MLERKKNDNWREKRMIKQLKTPDDISILFKLPDDIEKQLPCNRSEWIQWLVENVSNPRIGIWANIEQDQANGYIVAINNVMPPVSNAIGLLYIWYSWNPLKRKATRKLVGITEDWGREAGAKRIITAMAPDQMIHAKINGFETIGQLVVREL